MKAEMTYTGDTAANDSLPPGFFQGASSLFGSLNADKKDNGSQGIMQGIFGLLNNDKNPEFNPFEMLDVNPFMMAAMDLDMKTTGHNNGQAAGLESMLQGLTGQNMQFNNGPDNSGNIFALLGNAGPSGPSPFPHNNQPGLQGGAFNYQSGASDYQSNPGIGFNMPDTRGVFSPNDMGSGIGLRGGKMVSSRHAQCRP